MAKSHCDELSALLQMFQAAVHGRPFAELNQCLKAGPLASLSTRIEVYQTAYQNRLRESLRSDFTRLRECVSENLFEELVSKFIHQNPSETRNLAEYSRKFPDFLQNLSENVWSNKLSAEQIRAAHEDWLELECLNAATVQSVSVVRAQSGVPLKLKIAPNCMKTALNDDFDLVAYMQTETVSFLTIEKFKSAIFDFLKEEHTLDELSTFLNSSKAYLTDEEIGNLLSLWIELKIIVCTEAS